MKDPDGDRDSGFDDTICPVDFEQYGQITSDTLHRVLVTPLVPGVRLTVIFDCCHCQFVIISITTSLFELTSFSAGTAIELPFVYRSNADGHGEQQYFVLPLYLSTVSPLQLDSSTISIKEYVSQQQQDHSSRAVSL